MGVPKTPRVDGRIPEVKRHGETAGLHEGDPARLDSCWNPPPLLTIGGLIGC
ncbi:MAG: hypothetical protein P8179_13670 [Candidatus Thiodiazotropha sp.]